VYLVLYFLDDALKAAVSGAFAAISEK